MHKKIKTIASSQWQKYHRLRSYPTPSPQHHTHHQQGRPNQARNDIKTESYHHQLIHQKNQLRKNLHYQCRSNRQLTHCSTSEGCWNIYEKWTRKTILFFTLVQQTSGKGEVVLRTGHRWKCGTHMPHHKELTEDKIFKWYWRGHR